MDNPFFKNYGPIKAVEIYKILNLKPNNKISNQNVSDIKDLAHSKKKEITFFHSNRYKDLANKTEASFASQVAI